MNKDPLPGSVFDIQEQNRYVYSLNNPIGFFDFTGLTTKESISKDDSFIDLFKNIHYEKRNALNGDFPSYETVDKNSGWKKLLPSQSIFHDNGVGKPEQKFIHPDGREVVFDGDTLQPIQDCEYKGTYN